MRLVYGLVGTLLALGFVLYPALAISFSSGAPAAWNGSPGSNGVCTACHTSFDLNSGTGSVSIEAPESFVPGETLSFTVAVDNTTPLFPDAPHLRQGFEVSVHDADGNHVGELGLVDADHTQFASGDSSYVTHTAAGNELAEWTVAWTAPADAPDAVTFYVAGNAGNGGNGSEGDYIYTTELTVPRMTVSNEDEAAPLVARVDAVYPNPFARTATVDYTLERALPVTVTLYDGLGRAVRVLEEGARSAGAHTVRVEAGDLPAGVYFVEVRTPESRTARPLTLNR